MINKSNLTLEICVSPKKNIPDPQGAAVMRALHNMGYTSVANVTVGKHITLELDCDTHNETTMCEAKAAATEMCHSLLANVSTEDFTVVVAPTYSQERPSG